MRAIARIRCSFRKLHQGGKMGRLSPRSGDIQPNRRLE
jgi:hypothetical protein